MLAVVAVIWIGGMSPAAAQTIDSATVAAWSAPFRNWYYYPDHVIASNPQIPGYESFQNTDVPTVYQLPGDNKWYMSFIGFNGNGYNSFVAQSTDMVHWSNPQLAMGFGRPGHFDYGGRVLGGYLYQSYDIQGPRTLKSVNGKYWSLYGAYAQQSGYEVAPGYEGVASSTDGLTWQRAKNTPTLSVYDADAGEWERNSIYQPCLVEYNGTYYDFYNAADGTEQIGIATSTDLMNWTRYSGNPVITNGNSAYDTRMCSDPKVFRDGDHWTMFYFGLGDDGHADIMAAFSTDLLNWTASPDPLYKAGGNPGGLDSTFAHKISLAYNAANDTYYMYYCAVGDQGRGIGLLTSQPVHAPEPNGWILLSTGLLGWVFVKRMRRRIQRAAVVGIAGILFMFPSISFSAQPDSAAIDKSTVAAWSAPYRNWHYWPDHVIASEPKVPGYEEFINTDCATVYQLPRETKKWYMSFLAFNGKGYQTFVAESEDLIHWKNLQLAMGFGPEGEFDHGGVVLEGYLFDSYDVKAPRVLRRCGGKFWSLYYACPRQDGYESRPGSQGLASSDDGVHWKRASDKSILSVHEPDCGVWEKDTLYAPWLLEHNGRFYDFYNAAGGPEQSGVAFSNDLLNWTRYKHNPIVRNRPDGYDEQFCSDPKVFRDGDHWVMFYFGVGRGGAHIMAAFSRDLLHWVADPEPLYKAGGNPSGLDAQFAHKTSVVYNAANDTFYMYYCAVGNKGRGIGLITSKSLTTQPY